MVFGVEVDFLRELKPANITGFVEISRKKFVTVKPIDGSYRWTKNFFRISIRNGLARRNQTPVLYDPRAGRL